MIIALFKIKAFYKKMTTIEFYEPGSQAFVSMQKKLHRPQHIVQTKNRYKSIHNSWNYTHVRHGMMQKFISITIFSSFVPIITHTASQGQTLKSKLHLCTHGIILCTRQIKNQVQIKNMRSTTFFKCHRLSTFQLRGVRNKNPYTQCPSPISKCGINLDINTS